MVWYSSTLPAILNSYFYIKIGGSNKKFYV